jgi:putative tryptophan/tyrosine transport system substrate-binding protein
MSLRRVGIVFFFISLLFLAVLCNAQQSAVAHLGYLSPGDIPPYDNAFLEGLEDQGYILPGEIPHYDAASWKGLLKRGYFEGKRIRIDFRATGQHFERAPELAAELIGLNVDVIFAVPTLLVKATQDAARKATRPIPIVFALVFDPVGFGFVSSLARPGGNLTGVANVDPEFYAKQLEILNETFPRLSRVAFLTNPFWEPDYVQRSKIAVEHAALGKSIRLETLQANTIKDLEDVFAEITRRRIQAIVLPQSPLLYANRARIIDFAAKHRLPAIYGDALLVEEGGLMFYGSSIQDQKRRSAALVARILRGTKPADIPVEQPTTYKLVINLKTARALGLAIPQ